MFFICTLNASKVTFSQLLFEWRTACSFYRKTIRTDVKFLDDLVSKTESEPNFSFLHIASSNNNKKDKEFCLPIAAQADHTSSKLLSVETFARTPDTPT